MMRHLLDIFRRRATPQSSSPPPPPVSPDEWRPGDIAECLASDWYSVTSAAPLIGGPREYECYRVDEVIPAADKSPLLLQLSRWPRARFAAYGFRKVQPRADQITAADAAFVRQLRHARLPGHSA